MKNCGIIDVGSNTIRLSIYRYSSEESKLLMNRKEMAGLASYIKNGKMSLEGMEKASEVLSSFRLLLGNLSISEIYVFATASLRNIANSDRAVQYIEQKTGLHIDLISGEEEGKLSFYGALSALHVGEGILVDLGGGSTELVQFKDGRCLSSYSLDIGSLSLFRNCVSGIRPDKDERLAIRSEVKDKLAQYRSMQKSAYTLCGVGGTVRAVMKLANHYFDRDPACRTLSIEQFDLLFEAVKKPRRSVLLLLLKQVPDRMHTLIPGMIALRAIADAYNCKEIEMCPTGVREGYLQQKVMKGKHDEE